MKKQTTKQVRLDNLYKDKDILAIRLNQLNQLLSELSRIYETYYTPIELRTTNSNKTIPETMFLCNLSYRINTEFSQYIKSKLKDKEEVKKYRMRIVLKAARWRGNDYVHRLMFVEDLIKETERSRNRVNNNINKLLHN